MNITELTRKLKVTTDELFNQLPHLGFDIGRRAIKVDDQIADKIITAWKYWQKQEREKQKIAEIRGEDKKGEETVLEKREMKIPPVITVRELAAKLNLPITKVLTELMKNGVLVSMNERLDFDTASIIGEELNFKIILDEEKKEETDSLIQGREKLRKALEIKENSLSRPPIVVVMGHVDHGKTKILDAIRKTDVVAGESGGITQHIGAYQVRKNNKLITFIDTPGHEAFTAMRSRGARVADIAILVVAADDGVRPQTKEAIKIIQDAKLPFIVAINKIDKPEANIEKTKQDLSALNLLPEDWGGQVVCAPVSAKTGEGINELLDTIILMAEMEKEKIIANPDALAMGTIIESRIDKGEGPVATILVQIGTLKIGDALAIGNNYLGKVRILRDYNGQKIDEAKPGAPAKILGLKVAPEIGSVIHVPEDIKNLTKDFSAHRMRQGKDLSLKSFAGETEGKKAVNLIIKADVLGSVEAIVESLAKLETNEVKVKIIGKGLGIIGEADVLKAEAAKAEIIGFHIKPTLAVSDLAREKEVPIHYYEVIYHLIEDVKKRVESLKKVDESMKLIGLLEIIKIFRKENKSMIVGGRVIEGNLAPSETVVVTRGGKSVVVGQTPRLECSRQAVEKVSSGQECGVTFNGEPVIEVGDVLEFYQVAKS